MKIKNKRVLKNGAVAAYVYYKNEKKWKWRIIGRTRKQKGGVNVCSMKFMLKIQKQEDQLKSQLTKSIKIQ